MKNISALRVSRAAVVTYAALCAPAYAGPNTGNGELPLFHCELTGPIVSNGPSLSLEIFNRSEISTNLRNYALVISGEAEVDATGTPWFRLQDEFRATWSTDFSFTITGPWRLEDDAEAGSTFGAFGTLSRGGLRRRYWCDTVSTPPCTFEECCAPRSTGCGAGMADKARR